MSEQRKQDWEANKGKLDYLEAHHMDIAEKGFMLGHQIATAKREKLIRNPLNTKEGLESQVAKHKADKEEVRAKALAAAKKKLALEAQKAKKARAKGK